MIKVFFDNPESENLPLLIAEKIFKKPVEKSTVRASDICFSGTILHFIPKHYFGYIYGTGNIKYIVKKFPYARIYAFRGPLSCLTSKNACCGDPLILTGRYIPRVYKKYTIGVVLGINDIEKPSNIIAGKNNFNKIYPDIDPVKYVNSIAQCSFIVSATLTGIIIADSYNIPCIACTFDNPEKYPKNYFDFQDYYYTTGRKLKILDLSRKRRSAEIIRKCSSVNRNNFRLLQDSLLRHCPTI